MSFLGKNPADETDNGFPVHLENEISSGLATEFDELDGLRFKEIKESCGRQKLGFSRLGEKSSERGFGVLHHDSAPVGDDRCGGIQSSIPKA